MYRRIITYLVQFASKITFTFRIHTWQNIKVDGILRYNNYNLHIWQNMEFTKYGVGKNGVDKIKVDKHRVDKIKVDKNSLGVQVYGLY